MSTNPNAHSRLLCTAGIFRSHWSEGDPISIYLNLEHLPTSTCFPCCTVLTCNTSRSLPCPSAVATHSFITARQDGDAATASPTSRLNLASSASTGSILASLLRYLEFFVHPRLDSACAKGKSFRMEWHEVLRPAGQTKEARARRAAVPAAEASARHAAPEGLYQSTLMESGYHSYYFTCTSIAIACVI